MLESQQHVLEDRQGSSPDDRVQQLGEDLEEISWSGAPRPGLPEAECNPKPGWGPRQKRVEVADPCRSQDTERLTDRWQNGWQQSQMPGKDEQTNGDKD